MLTEAGIVVRVEPDALWVQARQKSACGACSAKEAGCGQSVLADWVSQKSILKVPLGDRAPGEFRENQEVIVGVPEDVVVRGTALLYALPLLTLIMGALLGHRWFGSDAGAGVLALLGLALGGWIASAIANQIKADKGVTPVLVDATHPE